MSRSKDLGTNTKLPTFLAIGADPFDVEWLRRNLAVHPEVHVPPSEIAYFSHPKRVKALGRDWYAAQFVPAPGERFIGEVTIQYMLRRNDPATIARYIRRTLPDTRMVAVIRNPLDRLFLEWDARALAGEVESERLLDYLRETDPGRDPLGLIANGLYAGTLRHYVNSFGDQLMVVLHDELREYPLDVYERILRHVGADPSFVPSDLGILESPDPERPALTEEELEELHAYFRVDVARLELMLGRKLEAWNEFGTEKAPAQWTGKWLLPPNWENASLWIEQLVGDTTIDQFELATPCAPWDVRALLDHMVSLLRNAVQVLSASVVEWHTDTATGPYDAFHEASAAFLAAVSNDSEMPESVDVDGGECSSHLFAYTVFIDEVVHGWDLAVATGQPFEIPSDVLATMERVGRPFLTEMPRTPETIGVEFRPPEDASATERFMAFVGRDPAPWRRAPSGRS